MEAPLTLAELELLKINHKTLKDNGKFEPPDIDFEDLQVLLAAAYRESGRRITNLDELQRIAESHGQVPDLAGASAPAAAPPKVVSINVDPKEVLPVTNGLPARKRTRAAAVTL